jgi:hypothetical protein
MPLPPLSTLYGQRPAEWPIADVRCGGLLLGQARAAGGQLCEPAGDRGREVWTCTKTCTKFYATAGNAAATHTTVPKHAACPGNAWTPRRAKPGLDALCQVTRNWRRPHHTQGPALAVAILPLSCAARTWLRQHGVAKSRAWQHKLHDLIVRAAAAFRQVSPATARLPPGHKPCAARSSNRWARASAAPSSPPTPPAACPCRPRSRASWRPHAGPQPV